MLTVTLGMVNSYQIGPYKDEVFVPSLVDTLVQQSVNYFARTVDIPSSINDACTLLSERVRDNLVEKSGMKRHKILVHSVIFKDNGQCVRIASKCLSDKVNDNYSVFTMKSDSGYILSVTVFAFYQE